METILKQINRGKNITDILEQMINDQKLNELKMVRESLRAGDLEERLDTIESTYEFNREKYDQVVELNSRDIKLQKKFLEEAMYIDGKDLTDYNSLVTILTSAVVLTQLENHPELLSNEELFLVSSSMVSVPIEDYSFYGEYLIDKNVLQAIIDKTDILEEQREICYDIFEYCDSFVNCDFSKEKSSKIINDIVDFINQRFDNKFSR